MTLNKLIISAILLAGIFLFSCAEMKKDENKDENENIYIKQKASVLNKEIKTLNMILGDTLNVANHVVFIYNGLDCETCIDKGYAMTIEMDKKKNMKFVYVITTSTSIAHDQLRNSYLDYVFYDEHDIIRKELKYIFTPALIFFDIENRIKLIFYPGMESETEEKNFINKCLKDQQKCST